MRMGLDEGRIRRGSVLRESQRAFRFEERRRSFLSDFSAKTRARVESDPIIPRMTSDALFVGCQSLTELRKSSVPCESHRNRKESVTSVARPGNVKISLLEQRKDVVIFFRPAIFFRQRGS